MKKQLKQSTSGLLLLPILVATSYAQQPGSKGSTTPNPAKMRIGVPDAAVTPTPQQPVASQPQTASQSGSQSQPSSRPALTIPAMEWLQSFIGSPELEDAQVGLSIMALGKVDEPSDFPSRRQSWGTEILFERQPQKRFLPASNLKLYTAALALKALGPTRTLKTEVYVRVIPKTKTSPLRRVLVLRGGGDPSFGLEGLRSLVSQVANKKLEPFDGIEVDGTFLEADALDGRYPDGWTIDDTLWYYGPEVSGLTFNRNQVDVVVTGGAKKGDKASVKLEPSLPGFELGRQIRVDMVTGGPELEKLSEEALLRVDRAVASPLDTLVRIHGKVAPGQKFTTGIAVPGALMWLAQVFADDLKKAGVKVGPSLTARSRGSVAPAGIERLVGTHASPPISQLLKDFLKPSDNLYGEMLLRLSSKLAPAPSTQISNALPGSATYGHVLLGSYLKSLGIGTDSLRFSDGSGLSRYNLLTPRATARLLAAMERQPGGQAFWEALPIAATDGTLKNRMKNSVAANNVRAKTGTFSIVNCLSGYVTTRDGTRLAVSVMTNFARNGDDARRVQNDIFNFLASTELTTTDAE